MENKCLVCGAIIPEGRQVCPTCKKGGKHEISKKLTDEEIIKAYFEDCNEDFCHTCPLSETDCCAEILNLIHRQKAEIERLTEVHDRTIKTVEELNAKNCGLEYAKAELQKQVEAWKAMAKELEQSWEISSSNEEKLQKQVDELTKQREVGREKLKNEIANKIFMSASHGAIQCKKMSVAIAEIEAERYVDFAWEMVQQAVKDTAKEILQGFNKWLKQAISDSYEIAVLNSGGFHGGRNRAFHEVKELVKKVAESKGVEVE